MIEKDKVIVLRTTRYGESDLVIQALNMRGAKVSLFAKAALKSKKRFGGGVLEPTHYIQIVYKKAAAQNSGSAMSMLQEATLLDGFQGIRESFDKLELALYFLQVVSRVSQEGVDDSPELFDVLGNGLRALQNSTHLTLLKTHFDIKILAIQGVLPRIEGITPFLQVGVRSHGSISIEPNQLRAVQLRCQKSLEEYLDIRVHTPGSYPSLDRPPQG